ncbi:MAG TPA: outer membrane protein assembly factor BamE [Gemmatimonadales bacterium]
MRFAWLLAAAAVTLSAPPLQAQDVQTIRPGMTEAEVRAAWGTPVTSRKVGDYAYLFYENGCLRSCGTYDLVVLQGGQVVDAIARGKNHNYDGVSSSPADRAPRYTPPSDSARRSS